MLHMFRVKLGKYIILYDVIVGNDTKIKIKSGIIHLRHEVFVLRQHACVYKFDKVK